MIKISGRKTPTGRGFSHDEIFRDRHVKKQTKGLFTYNDDLCSQWSCATLLSWALSCSVLHKFHYVRNTPTGRGFCSQF